LTPPKPFNSLGLTYQFKLCSLGLAPPGWAPPEDIGKKHFEDFSPRFKRALILAKDPRVPDWAHLNYDFGTASPVNCALAASDRPVIETSTKTKTKTVTPYNTLQFPDSLVIDASRLVSLSEEEIWEIVESVCIAQHLCPKHIDFRHRDAPLLRVENKRFAAIVKQLKSKRGKLGHNVTETHLQ